MFCDQASEVVEFRVVLYCVCVKDVKVKCLTLPSLELAEATLSSPCERDSLIKMRSIS